MVLICLDRLSLCCTRYLGSPVVSSQCQHTLEVVHYLRENGYHGLMGDHADYCIFDPPKLYSAKKIKLTLKFSVETEQVDMDEVAKALDLNPNRFPLTAGLLGCPRLPETQLQEFHARLIPGKGAPHKTEPGVLIKAVVNYVRTLVNIDDLDSLGAEIFGDTSDPRVAALKAVVAHYSSGTAEGYKKVGAGQSRTGVVYQTLASDTREAEGESKDWYEMVTQGRKATALLSSQQEETLVQLAGLSLQPEVEEIKTAKKKPVDPAVDSQEAVATVAAGEEKPSPAGQYPRPEQAKPPAEAQVPPPVPEVLRTAQERHRQGAMHPMLHQLLTTGELLLPVLLEEQGEQGKLGGGGVHQVYTTLRRRVYGILFNEHHRMFTQGTKKEELVLARGRVQELVKKLSVTPADSIVMKNKEPRQEREVVQERLEAAKQVVCQLERAVGPLQEDTVVREWQPYNRYQQPEAVSPLVLDWGVPTLNR